MKEKEEIQVQWTYQGKVVTAEDVPDGIVGMIYRITFWPSADIKRWCIEGHLGMKKENCTGLVEYIGKKLIVSSRKVKIGKRAIAAERASRVDGKAKTVKRVIKDTGWLSYNSSCGPLKIAIEQAPENFTKEILHWSFSKKNMSLMETVEQIRHEVLWKQSWNDHIGNWYRYDTSKELYEQHLQKMRDKPRKKKADL